MPIASIDEAYNKKSWHGPNLRGSLRGVRAEEASWRPGSENHNIWELALHAAYWKYVVRRRLLGLKRGSFSIPGSNFFVRPVEVSEKAWKEDLGVLDREHRELRAAILSIKKPTERQLHLIRGIAAHDLYHAGQIRLIRKLYSQRKGVE